MFAGLIVLIALIAEAPFFLILDGPPFQGLIAMQAAIGLAIVAIAAPPREGAHWLRLIWQPTLFALIPALWMIVQAIPLPVQAWNNFITKSAATALDSWIFGSVTIDTGATLLSLGRYLAGIATALLTAAVTIDRKRARLVLLCLIGVATILAAINIGLKLFDLAASFPQIQVLCVVSGLGVILAAGGVLLNLQHMEESRAIRRTWRTARLLVVGCFIALGLCTAALIGNAPSELFGPVCGLMVVVLLALVRRFGLRNWEIAFVTSGLVIAALIVSLQFAGHSAKFSLRFAQGAGGSFATTERMLSDAPMTGTGAGTFEALLWIYRGFGENVGFQAPTTAALIEIELGLPALLLILLLLALLIGMLCRGALARGRDVTYPAVGAGSTLALTIGLFQNASVLHSTIVILGAGIVGLGLAQMASRGTHLSDANV